MARENPAYLALDADECGRVGVVGESIAVPFVGGVAASFVLAATLRLPHGGPAYTDLKLSLSSPERCAVSGRGQYKTSDLPGMTYSPTDF